MQKKKNQFVKYIVFFSRNDEVNAHKMTVILMDQIKKISHMYTNASANIIAMGQ